MAARLGAATLLLATPSVSVRRVTEEDEALRVERAEPEPLGRLFHEATTLDVCRRRQHVQAGLEEPSWAGFVCQALATGSGWTDLPTIPEETSMRRAPPGSDTYTEASHAAQGADRSTRDGTMKALTLGSSAQVLEHMLSQAPEAIWAEDGSRSAAATNRQVRSKMVEQAAQWHCKAAELMAEGEQPYYWNDDISKQRGEVLRAKRLELAAFFYGKIIHMVQSSYLRAHADRGNLPRVAGQARQEANTIGFETSTLHAQELLDKVWIRQLYSSEDVDLSTVRSMDDNQDPFRTEKAASKHLAHVATSLVLESLERLHRDMNLALHKDSSIAPIAAPPTCGAPQGIGFTKLGSCVEGDVILGGTSCTPRCDGNYKPSEASLQCTLQGLAPATFSCHSLAQSPATLGYAPAATTFAPAHTTAAPLDPQRDASVTPPFASSVTPARATPPPPFASAVTTGAPGDVSQETWRATCDEWWDDVPSYCTGGGEWSTLGVETQERCRSLCEREASKVGPLCCWWEQGQGCYTKAGAKVTTAQIGVAMLCDTHGESLLATDAEAALDASPVSLAELDDWEWEGVAPPGEHPEKLVILKVTSEESTIFGGEYRLTRMHHNRPVWRNRFGSVVYWDSFWRMHYRDVPDEWYFRAKDYEGPLPPIGKWVVDGKIMPKIAISRKYYENATQAESARGIMHSGMLLTVTHATVWSLNGLYSIQRIHNNKPLFKTQNGAIIYWDGFWKMNFRDVTEEWYYKSQFAHGPLPPAGDWLLGQNTPHVEVHPWGDKAGQPLNAGRRSLLETASNTSSLAEVEVDEAANVHTAAESEWFETRRKIKALQTHCGNVEGGVARKYHTTLELPCKCPIGIEVAEPTTLSGASERCHHPFTKLRSYFHPDETENAGCACREPTWSERCSTAQQHFGDHENLTPVGHSSGASEGNAICQPHGVQCALFHKDGRVDASATAHVCMPEACAGQAGPMPNDRIAKCALLNPQHSGPIVRAVADVSLQQLGRTLCAHVLQFRALDEGAGGSTEERGINGALSTWNVKDTTPAVLKNEATIFVKSDGQYTNFCPAGSRKISTLALCKQAAIELDYVFDYADENPDYPKGCYSYNAGASSETVYFNEHSVGAPHVYAQPLCLEAKSKASLQALVAKADGLRVRGLLPLDKDLPFTYPHPDQDLCTEFLAEIYSNSSVAAPTCDRFLPRRRQRAFSTEPACPSTTFQADPTDCSNRCCVGVTKDAIVEAAWNVIDMTAARVNIPLYNTHADSDAAQGATFGRLISEKECNIVSEWLKLGNPASVPRCTGAGGVKSESVLCMETCQDAAGPLRVGVHGLDEAAARVPTEVDDGAEFEVLEKARQVRVTEEVSKKDEGCLQRPAVILTALLFLLALRA